MKSPSEKYKGISTLLKYLKDLEDFELIKETKYSFGENIGFKSISVGSGSEQISVLDVSLFRCPIGMIEVGLER